jgi:carbon storage regulator
MDISSRWQRWPRWIPLRVQGHRTTLPALYCMEAIMLVLSRRRDQAIMVGDDVEVTVVDIRGDKVRLGINAPRDVAVHRKEVFEAIKRENRSSRITTSGPAYQLPAKGSAAPA